MKKLTIVGIALIIILIVSLTLAWMMSNPESVEEVGETVIDIKPYVPNIPIPKPPPPPPLPNVYWSEFNRSLLHLEQEHIEILQAINPLNIKPVQQVTATQQVIATQQVVKIPTQELNWSDVSANLLELEQWRKDIISLLQEQSTTMK